MRGRRADAKEDKVFGEKPGTQTKEMEAREGRSLEARETFATSLILLPEARRIRHKFV